MKTASLANYWLKWKDDHPETVGPDFGCAENSKRHQRSCCQSCQIWTPMISKRNPSNRSGHSLGALCSGNIENFSLNIVNLYSSHSSIQHVAIPKLGCFSCFEVWLLGPIMTPCQSWYGWNHHYSQHMQKNPWVYPSLWIMRPKKTLKLLFQGCRYINLDWPPFTSHDLQKAHLTPKNRTASNKALTHFLEHHTTATLFESGKSQAPKCEICLYSEVIAVGNGRHLSTWELETKASQYVGPFH